LHRWARLAQGRRAHLPRLFDRQVDRYRRRRPLRSARSRDPRSLQGSACLRCHGRAAAQGQHDGRDERYYLDRDNPDILHNDVTVVDSALTRPWTVNKTYGREPNKETPFWRENNCGEYNNHVKIGNENYMLSADGYLMPTKKDQPPP